MSSREHNQGSHFVVRVPSSVKQRDVVLRAVGVLVLLELVQHCHVFMVAGASSEAVAEQRDVEVISCQLAFVGRELGDHGVVQEGDQAAVAGVPVLQVTNTAGGFNF